MSSAGAPARRQPRCPKCGEEVTPASLANSTQAKTRFNMGFDADCRECNLNYKAENRKHKRDPAAKKLWDQRLLDPSAAQDWYKKRKVVSGLR